MVFNYHRRATVQPSKASANAAWGEDPDRIHVIRSRKRVCTKDSNDRSFSIDDTAKGLTGPGTLKDRCTWPPEG